MPPTCGLTTTSFVVTTPNLSRITAADKYRMSVAVADYAVANAVSLNIRNLGSYRWAHVTMATLAVAVPTVLEWIGVIPGDRVPEQRHGDDSRDDDHLPCQCPPGDRAPHLRQPRPRP